MLACGFYESHNGDGDGVLSHEKRGSKEDPCSRIKSDSTILALPVMQFASQDPEIYFHEISEKGGLELIKALRSRSQAQE
jgi:hypothetical protein